MTHFTPIPKQNGFDRDYYIARKWLRFWKSKFADVRIVGSARTRQLTGTGCARIRKRSSSRPALRGRDVTGKRASYEGCRELNFRMGVIAVGS